LRARSRPSEAAIQRGQTLAARAQKDGDFLIPCPFFSSPVARRMPVVVAPVVTVPRPSAATRAPRRCLLPSPASGLESKACDARRQGRRQRRLSTDLEKQSLLAHVAPWRPGATAKRAKQYYKKSVGEEGEWKAPALGGGSVYGRRAAGPLAAEKSTLASQGRLGPSSSALKPIPTSSPPWRLGCCGSLPSRLRFSVAATGVFCAKI
jgi:hypothetical protein